MSPSTVVGYLDHWATVDPDRLALTEGDREWSYGALLQEVLAGQARLENLGVVAGDRVAIVGSNSAAWVTAFLSVLRAGAVAIPTNYRVSGKQLVSLIRLSAPRVVLADDAGRRVLAGSAGDLDCVVSDLEPVASGHVGPRAPVKRSATDTALISFTSGTTGAPKGAVISHGALLASALAFGPILGLDRGDLTTTLVPLFHNTGYVDQLAHMLTICGTLDVLPEFHTKAAVSTLQRRPAQYLATVPSILRLLMLHPSADELFAPCRVITFGGSPMPPAWSQEMAQRWPHLRLLHGYGLTEFTSATHILPAKDLLARGASVGPPLPGVECDIWNEEERPVPAGTVGEVVVAGPMRMDGYWQRPEETAAKIRERWLKTGDLGHLSADGYLTIHGRATHVINRGGEKINPMHLEEVLCRLPSVAECAVVSGPHPVLQERVLAAVSARPGLRFDEAQARALLAEEVPDYAIPERFVTCADLPHNAAGKVDRAGVRSLVLAALETASRQEPPSSDQTPTTHSTEAHR